MAWLEGIQDVNAVRERTERAVQAQIGLMSPLWVAFGAAASAGVAWWWMTHWSMPLNVEAVMGRRPTASVAPEAPPLAPAAIPLEAELLPEVETEEAASGDEELQVAADDLTQLFGVGPKIAMAFEARGITRFAQLAAWSDEDLAAFAVEIDLKGRALRSDLIEQARRLAGGDA